MINDPEPREASLQRRKFSSIWLTPIIAALIAIFLGFNDYSTHGPLITITFKTANGLIADQTQVKFKGVTIGTVENIHLSPDRSLVVVSVRMASSAKPLLTPKTRFWVERLRLDTFNATDFQSIVSGPYIQLEPGAPDRKIEYHYTGLESPPTDQSEQPGRIITLKSAKMDGIHVGAPIYYREAVVGEVLKYDLGNGFEPITLTILIRSPYDQFIRDKSRFWNVTGLSLAWGANGLHLETHSLSAILLGGIAFETPPEAQNDPTVAPNTVFTLYENEQEAATSTYSHRTAYVTYFNSSVQNLAPGSPVMIYGMSVGQVTSIRLIYDAASNAPKVRVDFEIDAEKAFGSTEATQSMNSTQILQHLIENGGRVRMETSNFLIGQKILAMEFVPNATPAVISQDGNATVIPSAGSADNAVDALGDVANKLDQIPFDEIGQNLSHLINHADKLIGGQDMQQTIHNLSIAMTNAADLSRKANKNMTPVLEKLPDISAQLQRAVAQADKLLTGLQNDYGDGSDFNSDAKRVLDQVTDAARSIRLLADYLDRHPEALLSGKDPEKDKP